jgi:predicted dehydrogenase
MHVKAAVAAGKHIFAEKPVAVDAPGVRTCLEVYEEANKKGIGIAAGTMYRHSAAHNETMRRLHDGQIGNIVAARCYYNTGSLWVHPRQPGWTDMEYQMRNWYYFTWLSGDHLVEQHVHYNDWVGWIMHEQPPLHAWGYGGRQVRTEAIYGDIFDHHAVVYEYPGGVRFYAFTRQQPNCFNENSELLFGTKGCLRSERGWSIFDSAGKRVWTASRQGKDAELNCFEEMFAGMKQGKPINDSLSMARSTMLAILGRMATHGGQRVTWDEAFASNLVLAPKSYAWDADPPVLPGPDGKYPCPIPGVTKVL